MQIGDGKKGNDRLNRISLRYRFRLSATTRDQTFSSRAFRKFNTGPIYDSTDLEFHGRNHHKRLKFFGNTGHRFNVGA